MDLLDSHGWPPDGVILHSYSGGRELIAPLARRGAYFSFSGSITWTRNRRGREAASRVPLERLLIETDAPDLPPAPTKPANAPETTNEPANLLRVAETLAELRGLPLQMVAEATWRNAGRLYGGIP